MYMKNLNHKMTLRLTDELKSFVDDMSVRYGISPSDFIRQTLTQSMFAQNKAQEIIEKALDTESLKAMASELKERGQTGNGKDRKVTEHDLI